MNVSQHLSEAQLDDALLGDLAEPFAAHLRGCADCNARMDAAQAPLAEFRCVATAWSERRSATLPLPNVQTAVRKPLWQRGLAGAMTLATCALALTISNASRHSPAPAAVAVTASADTAASNDEQVSRDNQMLSAIDRELAATSDTPAALGLQPVSAETRAAHSTSLQD
jgi:hypothetical protein